MIERLDRRYYAPAVCVSHGGAGTLSKEIDRQHIPIIEAPSTVSALPYATLPFRVRKAAKAFEPYKFALWHSFHYLDDYTEPLIARMAGAKWVYTKKNMNWHRRAWILRSLFASRIAAQNESMIRDFFSSSLFRDKVRLIPTSVDTRLFTPDCPPRLNMRKQMGIGKEEIVIVCVANLMPVKNHPMVIRAIAEVPGVHLWLAGRVIDPDYADTLQRMCEERKITDRVHFLSSVADIPALLSEADIFCMQSINEGCPYSLLEAMSCGLPVVVTDIPGLRAPVDEGVNALLVKLDDHDAMARAFRRLSEDGEMRRQIGAAARRKAVEHYDLDREARQYSELYKELLETT